MLNDIKVSVNGIMSVITPADGVSYTRAELQSHCGGGIRLFPTEKYFIIVNIDGDMLLLPFNGIVTSWLIDAKHNANARGTALLVHKENIDLPKILDRVEVGEE